MTCFQKQKPLSGENAPPLKTFRVCIVSKQRDAHLALEWFRCAILQSYTNLIQSQRSFCFYENAANL